MMCDIYCDCYGCPFEQFNKICSAAISDETEKAVAIVEKWSEEHPIVTNGDKIWEMIPSDLRSTTIKQADSEVFDECMITAKDHIELSIVKDWWDAEYRDFPSVKKTGEWNFVGDNLFQCTHCGVTYTTDQLNAWRNNSTDPYAPKWCPHCGARMGGE